RWDCDIDPGLIISRVQNGDAFPDEITQWSDSDGDGFGDNYKDNSTYRLECWPGQILEGARNPDALPLRYSQNKDPDRDGFGDNTTLYAYQGDICDSVYGTSTEDRYGCPDTDGDGWSDVGDSCMYDPDIHSFSQGECVITSSGLGDSGEDEGNSKLAMYTMGAVVVLLLSMIFVALVAKQMGARKRLSEIKEMHQQEIAFNDEEEERRQKWIDHYLSTGDIEKAKELGYIDKADWQIHMEQEAVEKASLPSLDELLD
ncbi:MAG: hypothetical protein NZ770_08250, partial [Candidatus Poseidoniaceae archaeon]|nr:hypothetical protein [Candidatus Poseidoniaceae archaeon]